MCKHMKPYVYTDICTHMKNTYTDKQMETYLDNRSVLAWKNASVTLAMHNYLPTAFP